MAYAYSEFDAEVDADAEDEQPLLPEEEEAELGELGEGDPEAAQELEEEEAELGEGDLEAAQVGYVDADDEPPQDEDELQDEVPDEDGFQEEEGVLEKPPEDEEQPSEIKQGKERGKYKKPLLFQQDDGKYAVRMRQQLKHDEIVDAFCDELQTKIDQLREAGEMMIFEDFDISENRLAGDQLATIFGILADGTVHVERFRAFGCPTLNDEATTFLAGWLAGVAPETAPFELHLSDCAITSEGFYDLMKTLQENAAFPGPDPKNPTRQLPMYLRLEHNYIEDTAIQQAIDDQILVAMQKGNGFRHSSEIKARLLVREDGKFQQKKGTPPAPEDVPPPRPVNPKGKGKGKGSDGGKGQGKGKGKSKGSDSRRDDRSRDGKARGRDRDRDRPRETGGSYRDRDRDRDRARDWQDSRDSRYSREGKGGGRGTAPPWAALPAPTKSSNHRGDRRRLEVERPGPLRRDNRDRSGNDLWESISNKSNRGSNVPYNAFSRGSGGRDGDRKDSSRPGRSKRPPEEDRAEDSKRYRPSSAPNRPRQSGGDAERAPRQRPGKGGLPPDWETHWSDEYGIWYYWNMKTGDSSWEKPKS